MKDAFGHEPVFMGAGGTIPFVADFARAFPKATLLLTGAGDPFSNAHSEDESVDLGDLERSTLAEALFIDYLASG
jgi:acetylornithine deacetylase/succinyl-diaminopimelate desuccinylase-like protein